MLPHGAELQQLQADINLKSQPNLHSQEDEEEMERTVTDQMLHLQESESQLGTELQKEFRQQESQFKQRLGSRSGSRAGSRAGSAVGSRA